MSCEVPSYVPKFVPTTTSTATTYHFRVDPRGFGWALCTVNDQTGELLIMSDWGHWSYRWNASPENLGSPALTHFLGKLPHAESTYLAHKLMTREQRQRFDLQKTVAAFHKALSESRLEVGRNTRSPRLTRQRARELWDDIAGIDAFDYTEFCERFQEIDGYELIDDLPWESLEYVPTTEYMILVHGILPALIDACAEEVKRRADLANRHCTGHLTHDEFTTCPVHVEEDNRQ